MEQPNPLEGKLMSDNETDYAQGQNPNPAWQGLLDLLPQEFHSTILPQLEGWDKSVQDKLQAVRSEYDPYKNILDQKIDPEILEGALVLANQLQDDPKAVVQQAIEHFELDFVEKAIADANAVNNSSSTDDDSFDLDELGTDITSHPMYKAIADQVKAIQDKLDSTEQETKAQQEEREFEETLSQLQEANKDKGEFDRLYVSALVTNGVPVEKAVETYYDTISKAVEASLGKSNNSQDGAPIVMGGDGISGSGLPDNSVRMGDLTDQQTKDLVNQMLAKARQA